MEWTLKTKEVSEQLGVNPTTIQRWAKYFGLKCETNEHGHYLYTKEHVAIMREVQQQLQQGKRMREIKVGQNDQHHAEIAQDGRKVETYLYEEKLEKVMSRIEELDEKISKKADEVVSYQLLKHRTELEEMMKMIKSLEERIIQMEERMQDNEYQVEQELPMVVGGNESKKKWRSFKQMFSF
ncbi:chromosome-anchoring protein RacA [Halalkalibacter krulwichiae]|uniref:Chromosome-anchoring protein RacA n=1 Tax=Halalkalibacter krulwichiae TaxID=199441 RepID=A0A1X9MAA7_9BACI|nr:chromosome-anchoring protein RacA [Halalkalibacter krulwichiae]ARK30355.1 Chromosome-anchoring protein RacA [Halalkalibacter krulwichiae]